MGISNFSRNFFCFEFVSGFGEVPKTLEKVEQVKGIEPSARFVAKDFFIT